MARPFIFPAAYHALPPLTRKSDGLPIGAVSGFCNMIHRMIEANTGPDAPTHAAVVFDKGSHTFRNDMYDLYKANREAMPEDLRPQIPLTREAGPVPSTSPASSWRITRPTTSSPRSPGRRAEAGGGAVTIILVRQGPDAAGLGGGVEMFDR